MTNDIGDIVLDRHGKVLAMIVDIEFMKANTFMFHLYNLKKESIEKWFEPFGQQLNAGYWQTLA